MWYKKNLPRLWLKTEFSFRPAGAPISHRISLKFEQDHLIIIFQLYEELSKIAVVDVIKFFLEEISISPKLRNGKKFVLMSKLAHKCVNNAILKQIYTLKLLIAFKMAHSCCFSLGGNLDFLDFLQKKVL